MDIRTKAQRSKAHWWSGGVLGPAASGLTIGVLADSLTEWVVGFVFVMCAICADAAIEISEGVVSAQ